MQVANHLPQIINIFPQILGGLRENAYLCSWINNSKNNNWLKIDQEVDGEYWQVESLRLFNKYEIELNLVSYDIHKKICIDYVEIEKREAYKLLCAVFDNTEHEKSEGEDYEDVEDFYGWELS